MPNAMIRIIEPMSYTKVPVLADARVQDWQDVENQLLVQWERLTKAELDQTGYNPCKIAALVQSKYGVPAKLVECYLVSLNRALPDRVN